MEDKIYLAHHEILLVQEIFLDIANYEPTATQFNKYLQKVDLPSKLPIDCRKLNFVEIPCAIFDKIFDHDFKHQLFLINLDSQISEVYNMLGYF